MQTLLTITPFTWFWIACIPIFAGVICFFSINSAWADKKKSRNRTLIILGLTGVVIGLAILYFGVINIALATGFDK